MKRLLRLSRLSLTLVIYMAYAGYGGSIIAQRIAAGGSHTCRLGSNVGASCWGRNQFGQLGHATMTPRSTVPVVVVPEGIPATAISAGSSHTCVMASGAVGCWGHNHRGQLGNGTTRDSAVPVAVNLGRDVITAVAAGGDHTCAVLSNGGVRCWGYNIHGQLGDGTTTRSSVPVTVNDLGGQATAVAAGALHTCAVLSNGAVRCWGLNQWGQLGNTTVGLDTAAPVSVNDLGGQATAVTAGLMHTCALMSNGTVRCWGRNPSGQLGNGRTTARLAVPVSVTNLGGQATAVTAGWEHTCGLLSNGTVRCWGLNDRGQLGNGTHANSSVPVTVNLGGTAIAVAAGAKHTCALLTIGGVRCWGYNYRGQLGNGTTTSSTVPVALFIPGPQ